MKVVLVVLILCFFVNLISAFSWFSFRSYQQPKQITESSSTHRPTFHFQRSKLQQQNQLRNGTNPLRQAMILSNKNNGNYSSLQRIVNRLQYQVRNTSAVQRQADSINKTSSQINPQNRFQAIAYQQQHRSLNNRLAFRQIINNTNNQIVHPRFRLFRPIGKNNTTVVNPANRRIFSSASLSKSIVDDSESNNSSMMKNNIQPIRYRLVFAKAIATSTKPDLLRALTTQATDINGSQNWQRLLADFYYQQQLRAFYQRLNEQNAALNHLNINSALKKRKREDEPKVIQSDAYYPMILTRDKSSNEENKN